MAKQLQVLANLDNPLLENFMWLMGVMQDHGIITGGLKETVMNHYTEKLHHAVDQSVGLLEQTLRRHGHPATVKYSRCLLNESSCPYVKEKSFHIILYNCLAWNVTIPVRIPADQREYSVFRSGGGDDDEIYTALLPIPSPVLPLTTHTHDLVFMAEVPAVGYRSYYIQRNGRGGRYVRSKGSKKRLRQANEAEDYDDGYEIPVTTSEPKVGHAKEYKGQNKAENSGSAPDAEQSRTAGVNRAMYAEESNDDFIKNQYIQINLDKHERITSLQLSNGLNASLDLQYYHYVSDDPYKVKGYVDPSNPEPFVPDRKSPGTYIFRTMDLIPVPIHAVDTKVYKTDVVQEIHCRFSTASYVVRLYDDRPVVEVDWMVGTVPVEDGLGKEVFIRYTTDLESAGVFYTDANGRQTMKRRRNMRGMYEPFNLDQIAGNIYPVTSRIYLEDLKRNIRFSIFNDRPQGGTSLHDGAVDVMLQRRLLTDDAGFQAFLNGSGVVRGTHHLYLSRAKANRVFEKKLAKEIELHPLTFVAQEEKEKWMSRRNEFSALKTKLPIGVHVLTVQDWQDNTMLLRLENYLEKIDAVKSGTKRVNINDLFNNIKIKKLRETMLAGHIWIEDWAPLRWQLKNSFLKNFNDFYGNNTVEFSNHTEFKLEKVDLDNGVRLTPQQIRTFVVWFEYIN